MRVFNRPAFGWAEHGDGMKRTAVALIGLLSLTGCGVRSQQTPEPSDTSRVNALIQQLGDSRTYDRRTLIVSPDPDGIVLQRWIERRKAMLEGTLNLEYLPAMRNPGAVANTIKWELDAERVENGESNALNHYALDMVRRESYCPQVSKSEKLWFANQEAEHAKGKQNTLINFPVTTKKFQQQCDVESTQYVARRQAEKNAADAIRQNFTQENDDCKKISEAAEAAYASALTPETGKAATEADVRMNDCQTAVQRRWYAYDPNPNDHL